MNNDRAIGELMLALLHTVAVARVILGQIAYPITLPQVISTDTMPDLRDAFARCFLLLEDEPLVSLVPGEAAELLRQGLGMLLLADEHMQFIAHMVGEDEAEKLEAWRLRALEDLIAQATSLLYLAQDALND